QFLRVLSQGHNRFGLVEAEEGMGKTRLAEELARRADRRGIKVLHVNCDANEVFPYHAIQPLIVQARRKLEGVELDKVLGHGAELITSVTAGSGGSANTARAVDKFRLFDVFSRMLEAISDHKPCLLIVDDVHQADADSFELLSYLVRDLVYHPEEKGRPAWGIVWLTDLQREPHVSERIRQVTASHDITRMQLAPFSPEELTRFVVSILGDHERAQALSPLLHGETGGNPGFTYETLKGMVDSGNLVPERGGWKLLGGVQDGQLADVLPQSLREAYANRLSRLPEGARELLVVAAMLGSEFNYQELRHCANDEEAEVLRDLDTLLQHRLLREVRGRRQGQLAFVLPQIRKHLISEMSFAGQQQLHLQILRALETAYEQGDRRVLHALAWHARRAGVVDKSLKYLLLAAQAAARSLAHDRASDLFEQASGLPGFAERITPELRDLMYEVLMSANRFTRAADLARQSAQLESDPAPRAHWLHRLGRALTGQSKHDEALHYFNASLETLGFKTYHGGALMGSVALEFLRHLPSLRRPDAVSERPAPATLVEALEVMLDLPNLF
ncbi:MAG: ATP-binding protein, partial [Candidatus Xenobia bacterium]